MLSETYISCPVLHLSFSTISTQAGSIHHQSKYTPTAAHYLQQHITYSSKLPTATHYLQQHITYSSTLPTAARYLQQHITYANISVMIPPTKCPLRPHYITGYKNFLV